MANDQQGTGLGNTPFPGTTIYPETHDASYPSALCIRGWCTGVPTDTTAGRYAPGCLLTQTDASSIAPSIWINEGTAAVPVWAAFDTLNDAIIGYSQINVAHALYSFAVDGGAAGTITPAGTVQIPANAIVVGATINSPTAAAGSGVSFSVGVSAGATPATTKILGATVVASLGTDALVNGTPTFASPFKMTTAGNVTYTITGGTATAGIIESFVYYVVALNS